MNKLTKVGCSALCGSLAAISAANAGELTVTGGADLTWVSLEKRVTGNPIGMGSNYTLKGSGELDNGWTFGVTIANTNANAYSTTAINLDMGGLGKLNFNQGDSGNGIQAYDDKMPTAWEEAHGAGLSTGVRGLVKGVGTSSNVQWSSPTFAGASVALAYAPRMGDVDNADKTGGGDTHTTNRGHGYDVTINMNPSLGTEILSGLNMFVGGHTAEKLENSSPTQAEDDAWQGVAGVTYDIGPLSLGHQWSAEYSGETSTSTAFNTYKNWAYGIAFNVNDDLSVSFGHMESYKAGYNNSDSQDAFRRVTVESWQAAYTMGGASVRLADVTADNAFFGSGTTADISATIVSLGLAF